MDLFVKGLAIFIVIQAACAENAERIVGGQIIDVTSVPYIVSVEYNNHHLCGGSIINESWILSAAHCSQNKAAEKYRVRSGTSRKNRNGQIHAVEEVIVHPNYSTETLDNDFMLLKLKEPMIFDDRQQSISLADSYMYYEGAQVLTSGFGETQNPLQSSTFLRGVIVEITSQEKCATYGSLLTSNMFCAAAKHKDSCQGDSGGPVESVYYGTLLGVVSFGMGCADEKYPGVYSKVSEAKEWIELTIAK